MNNNNLIEVNLDKNTTIFIETDQNIINNNDDLFSHASSGSVEKIVKRTKDYFEKQLEEIKVFSNYIIKSLENVDNGLNEIEVEFAIKIGNENGIVISLINAEATAKIKFKWSKKIND